MTVQPQHNIRERILINGYPCLLGNPYIEDKSYFNLNPGQKINQIGCGSKNGKESSSSRIQKFDVPITFRGFYDLDGTNFLTFQFEPGYCKGFDLFNPEQNVFTIYEIGDNELYQYSEQIGLLIFKPLFKIIS